MPQNSSVKNTVIPSWTNMPSNSERRSSRTRNTVQAETPSASSDTTAARFDRGRARGRNSSSSSTQRAAVSAITAPSAHDVDRQELRHRTTSSRASGRNDRLGAHGRHDRHAGRQRGTGLRQAHARPRRGSSPARACGRAPAACGRGTAAGRRRSRRSAATSGASTSRSRNVQVREVLVLRVRRPGRTSRAGTSTACRPRRGSRRSPRAPPSSGVRAERAEQDEELADEAVECPAARSSDSVTIRKTTAKTRHRPCAMPPKSAIRRVWRRS